MKKPLLLLLTVMAVCLAQPGKAQLLKKLKDKVNKAVNTSTDTGNTGSTDSGTTTTDASGKPTNKGGAGLKNTAPPDVNQQIADAEQEQSAAKYSDARYSIQQALIGIEIQLGRQLLQSLPNPVDGLAKDTMQDKVMSTQWGWNNMTIQRVYTDKKDKQLTVTIGNNAMYASIANVYFNNSYMVQANADNQNVKQTKVKGNKAIIQYEDSKGYTLLVALGQSSMIVWECINFADENEVMTAANSFDIDGIKKMLGEQ
jgi:hypothetical protein